MPELISRADANQAVVELLGERIAAVLRDLDQVTTIRRLGSHYDGCWEMHADCLAARIRRTLTREDHHV